MDEANVEYKQELTIVQLRQLRELHQLDKCLNEEEMMIIVAGYNRCIERLMKGDSIA